MVYTSWIRSSATSYVSNLGNSFNYIALLKFANVHSWHGDPSWQPQSVLGNCCKLKTVSFAEGLAYTIESSSWILHYNLQVKYVVYISKNQNCSRKKIISRSSSVYVDRFISIVSWLISTPISHGVYVSAQMLAASSCTSIQWSHLRYTALALSAKTPFLQSKS